MLGQSIALRALRFVSNQFGGCLRGGSEVTFCLKIHQACDQTYFPAYSNVHICLHLPLLGPQYCWGRNGGYESTTKGTEFAMLQFVVRQTANDSLVQRPAISATCENTSATDRSLVVRIVSPTRWSVPFQHQAVSTSRRTAEGPRRLMIAPSTYKLEFST